MGHGTPRIMSYGWAKALFIWNSFFITLLVKLTLLSLHLFLWCSIPCHSCSFPFRKMLQSRDIKYCRNSFSKEKEMSLNYKTLMTALDVQNLSNMNLGQCCLRQYTGQHCPFGGTKYQYQICPEVMPLHTWIWESWWTMHLTPSMTPCQLDWKKPKA